jgi:hypothetical protein
VRIEEYFNMPNPMVHPTKAQGDFFNRYVMEGGEKAPEAQAQLTAVSTNQLEEPAQRRWWRRHTDLTR